MARPFIAVLWFAALAVPALGAVNKDGGTPAVNPCVAHPTTCEQADRVQDPEPVKEPMVIFLDADGNTLARLPLSRFREAKPDAKLPPDVDHVR
ncbi:MAG: hypothetical protein ABI624_23850 [Casimicrobiaceae bacterium]